MYTECSLWQKLKCYHIKSFSRRVTNSQLIKSISENIFTNISVNFLKKDLVNCKVGIRLLQIANKTLNLYGIESKLWFVLSIG